MPGSSGVVLSLAGSDHWRGVLTTTWEAALLTSGLQRPVMPNGCDDRCSIPRLVCPPQGLHLVLVSRLRVSIQRMGTGDGRCDPTRRSGNPAHTTEASFAATGWPDRPAPLAGRAVAFPHLGCAAQAEGVEQATRGRAEPE